MSLRVGNRNTLFVSLEVNKPSRSSSPLAPRLTQVTDAPLPGHRLTPLVGGRGAPGGPGEGALPVHRGEGPGHWPGGQGGVVLVLEGGGS